MTGGFGARAARLAGLSGALLGWPPDRFWTATPAELAQVLTAMAPAGEQAIAGPELQRLMEQFPDG